MHFCFGTAKEVLALQLSSTHREASKYAGQLLDSGQLAATMAVWCCSSSTGRNAVTRQCCCGHDSNQCVVAVLMSCQE
jgi:hypothetical protein